MLGSRRFWAIALIILASLGLFAVSQQFVLSAPRVNDPDASLRAIAVQHLGAPDALEQLRAALKTVPQGHDVIIFGPSTDWGGTEVYMLTSYLHWPNKVWFVQTGGAMNTPPPPAVPESAKENSILFFYGIDPPPELAGNAKRIGKKMAMIAHRR